MAEGILEVPEPNSQEEDGLEINPAVFYGQAAQLCIRKLISLLGSRDDDVSDQSAEYLERISGMDIKGILAEQLGEVGQEIEEESREEPLRAFEKWSFE